MKKLKMLLALMLVMALIASLASCTIIEGLTGSEQSGTVGGEELENPENPSDPEQPNDPETPEEPQEPENPSDPEPETPDEPDQPSEPEPLPHEHTFATEWSKDDNRHWHAASCEHSELKADEAEHTYDAVSGNCVCGDHIHVYSTDWMRDESSHWHGAICEHIELKVDEAAHVFVDGYCVCGEAEPVAPHVHTFSDEWTYNENQHWHEATCGHNGLRGSLGEHVIEGGVCECGYRPHVHTYSTEWSKNDNKHWHSATCEHAELKIDEADHSYDPVTGSCVCGAHIHVYSTEWTKDDTKHWHAASCEHTDLKADEAEHHYINDVCECGKAEPDYGPEPADHFKSGTPVGTMTQLFKMSAYTDSEGRYCRVLQGGCTDGRYYYAFFNDAKTDSDGVHSAYSASVCHKYDMTTNKLVATYEGLMVEHVNDATYVPDTHEIIAVHCSPNRKLLSVLDADTLLLKRQITVDDEIYSLAYDQYEKCYWAGLSYANGDLKGDSFAKLDLNFRTVAVFPGEAFGYTRQGMDVDSEYIYFARYTPNCVLVYDKQGNFVNRIALSKADNELENIFHIGDTFYLGYYTTKAGGILYSFALTDTNESGSVTVDMKDDDALITLAQRTDADGNVCKVAQCSATDGTYIYFLMNNDVKANYTSSLYKYDIASGKIVATLDGFKTGHTNDVTYNSKTNELIVANNVPNFTLSIIDAETLELKRNITVESDIFAIAYDEVNDCYYGSNRASYGIIKLDSDFNFVAELMTGVSTGYSRQAIDTDGTYIYMLQSAANCVLVYRVDGSFVGMSYLLPAANTAQSICHLGDTFYIGYNVSTAGGIVYTTEIEIIDDIIGDVDDSHVHTYEETWSMNDTHHWHASTCAHSGLQSDIAAHSFVLGICICGKTDAEPADVIKGGTPLGTMTEIIKMSAHTDAQGRNCRVLQGGCTDGRYYYAFFNDSLKDADGNHSASSASTVYKYDMTTNKLVATYENVMVEHCNDATYVPFTNEIFVANCSPTKNLITVLDADTMEQKRQFTIDFDIYSIAYDPFESCFWIGLSYGDNFAKLDLEFNLIASFEGVPYGYTRQGMDVDSKYIYFARYQPNCVLVYDKAGNFVDRIALSKADTELENIFHIGDTFYLGYYTASKGGKLYSFKLTDLAPSGDVKVDMTPENALVTLDQRTDANGNVCKVTQGSASDGTYVYFLINNDVKANYTSSLYKYEIATGKIVATLDGFKTGQSNDMTYNSKTGELIVVQNSPTNILTIIDAATLTVKRDVNIASNLISIAYDELQDCYYAVARTNPYTIAKLDSEFNYASAVALDPETGYSRQTLDTDGEYIYMMQSAVNTLFVYRVDGTFVGMSYLLPSVDTAQSICHSGDTFYIGYNVADAGGTVYAVEIDVTDTVA